MLGEQVSCVIAVLSRRGRLVRITVMRRGTGRRPGKRSVIDLSHGATAVPGRARSNVLPVQAACQGCLPAARDAQRAGAGNPMRRPVQRSRLTMYDKIGKPN